MLFKEYIIKNSYKKFIDKFIEETNDYADIMQIGSVDGEQIFKEHQK